MAIFHRLWDLPHFLGMHQRRRGGGVNFENLLIRPQIIQLTPGILRLKKLNLPKRVVGKVTCTPRKCTKNCTKITKKCIYTQEAITTSPRNC